MKIHYLKQTDEGGDLFLWIDANISINSSGIRSWWFTKEKISVSLKNLLFLGKQNQKSLFGTDLNVSEVNSKKTQISGEISIIQMNIDNRLYN